MSVETSAPPASATRIRGLDHATVPVRDQFTAARFYACVFNAEIDHVGRRFLERCPPEVKQDLGPTRNLGMGVEICDGVVLALFEQDFGQPQLEQGHPHHAFAIGSDELDLWLAQLRYWGVPHFAYGRARESTVSVYFNDLDGNHLELACSNLSEEICGRFASTHDDRAPAIEQWPPTSREAEANHTLRQKLLAAQARRGH